MSQPIKQKRFFNTAGPMIWEDHYFINPLQRINLEELLSLIAQKKYFILHAPRQTGKTSYLLALMEYLNKEGTYTALYANIENAQAARENVEKGITAILASLERSASFFLKDPFLKKNWKSILEEYKELSALETLLSIWCEHNEKPIVLFIDEVDALVGDTLISFLRQLRSGYPNRPQGFPQSIILCGVRDIRDYRIHSDREKAIITGGSAFNIKSESLRLGNFTSEEIKQLYLQHTENTGQSFHPDVFPLVWDLTEGQPWLVNALAYEVAFRIKENQNRQIEITPAMILQAKDNLILRRETHLDQLADKLKEERVKRVLMPFLMGMEKPPSIPDDDFDYVSDLGLIQKKPDIKIANRIYQEIIPRQLTYTDEYTITEKASWYQLPDGKLDMVKLLSSFQQFFRRNFESWIGGFHYAEAGPQLLLQAFLQRIVNGGGRVEREYGLGRMRTDLLIMWPLNVNPNLPEDHYARFDQVQQIVIELKMLHQNTLETTIQKGLEQTYQYMDKCGTKEGYLVIFNNFATVTWDEKIFQKEESYLGVPIKVFGM